jgi:NAD+ diphosphatase
MLFQGLRRLYDAVDETLFFLAGRARQIVDWDRTHQFCGQCGTPMGILSTERAKKCPRCGLLHFPHVSPAIIVLVKWGRKLLLGRSPQFPPGMYSVLAGFAEPGETLEEAVAREVQEEAGIRVKDIRYFGSQPWPFPHSLMIGFTANYASGVISLDGSELEDARWYTTDNLPTLPGSISIARKLIDWFLAKEGAG